MHRSRKLLDLAHRVEKCMACDRCTPDGCEPAHANWVEFGKGMGNKAHDHWHAALCHDCHRLLDQGSTWSREERRDIWLRAHIRTMDYYWANKWLEVA